MNATSWVLLLNRPDGRGFCRIFCRIFPWFLQDSLAWPVGTWLNYKLICSASKNWREAKDFHAAPYLTSNENFISNYHPQLYKVIKHHSCMVSKRHNIEAFYVNAGGCLGFVVRLLVCFCLKLHQFWHAVAIISFKFNEANEQCSGNVLY